MALKDHYKKLFNELKINKVVMDNGKVFPVSFTPYFITQDRYKKLGSNCEKILEVLEIFINERFEKNDFDYLFPENNLIKDLSLIKPNYKSLLQYARFDFIESNKGDFKLLEVNTAAPAGVLLIPFIKKITHKIDYYRNSIQRFNIFEQDIDCEKFFFDFLIDIYKKSGGKKANPNIAYINSKLETITSDLEQFLRLGKKLNYNVVNAYVQDIYCKDKQVYCSDQVIDIAHPRLIFSLDKNFNIKPSFYQNDIVTANGYIEAVSNNYFTHINSMPSYWVTENKKVLAWIQNDSFLKKLDLEQINAIKKLSIESIVPNKFNTGFVKENKNNFVVKSAMDTRGRSVYIGKEIETIEWQNLINKIIDKPFVIQKYIESKKCKVNIPQSSSYETMNSTISMYLVGGKFSGLLCRSSSENKTNFYKSGILRNAYVCN